MRRGTAGPPTPPVPPGGARIPYLDSGGGWLIFTLPPAEVAVHPTEWPEQHEFFLRSDDLDATLNGLAARGVDFAEPVSEQPWGRLCAARLPGGGRLGLHQPSHPRPIAG